MNRDIVCDLIYDVGANNGEDTAFYLAKGFRVLAVEANPRIAELLFRRFKQEIAENRLEILNEGIVEQSGTFTFYRNLDNDHWSSFDPAYGTRSGTRYETMEIGCRTIESIVTQYGVPYYLKSDVEGGDRQILQGLRKTQVRPSFVSVEEYGVQTLRDLQKLGYEAFFISPQRDKSWVNLPVPSEERKFVQRSFTGYDSGPFGRDLPKRWHSFSDAFDLFTSTVRREDQTYVGPEYEWHDIHASMWRNIAQLSPSR